MIESNYTALLNRLREDFPEHPLLSVLSKGTSALNDRRLLSAIADLNNRESAEQEAAEEEELPEEFSDDVGDNIMRQLYIQKSNLFVQRAKESNKLIDCESDQQRAKVVEQILIIQGQIEAHFHRMKSYRKNGVLPENDEEFPLHKDSVKLMLQLNSIRASISQYTAKIRELYHVEQKSKVEEERLANYEGKLKHFETYKKIVDNEIGRRQADANIHE